MKVLFTTTLSVHDVPVILKCHNLQSLDKAMDYFIEIKFCKSEFYFLNRRINYVRWRFKICVQSISDHLIKTCLNLELIPRCSCLKQIACEI